jgi:hypothetical protein
MRKKLWGCAVAAALAALGGGLAVDYACDHPDSWLGRCLFTAQDVAVVPVQTLRSATRPAELVLSGMQGLLGRGAGAVCEDAGPCPAPEAAADECPPPAVLPGGVAMHEDEGVLPEQPMPPVRDLVGGLPVASGAEDCEDVPMPRVEDDAPRMPRAEDRDEDYSCPEKKSGPESPGPAVAPARKDGDTSPSPAKHCGGEGCQSVSPKLRRDGGEAPRHPDVDTMEIRPSDLWFLDYTGPF